MANINTSFLGDARRLMVGAEVFDQIKDMVYFVKDADCRYVAVNQALVERCGLKSKSDLMGKTAKDVFPTSLGDRFAAQDREVIQGGNPIRGELELHLFPRNKVGWCLTWKEPIYWEQKVVGLSGISRDLDAGVEVHSDLSQVSLALNYIRKNPEKNLHIDALAQISGLSQFQLDSRIKSLFGVTTGQFVTRSRIELACKQLQQTSASITDIAHQCGYTDVSAFSRRFQKTVGLTPTKFREERNPDA